ncbi:MAG: hypothetical protein ISR58_12545 [Anaerolineales bacterium]|nr:hypothetical protein [Anaerolineales bacterium]
MMVRPTTGLLFTNATESVEVCVGTISQHLCQTPIQIEGVVGGDRIDSLLKAVTEAVVGVSGYGLGTGDRDQPVGSVVGIGADAITE